MRRPIRLLAAAVVFGLATAGCGQSMLKTKGRVVRGGAPFVPQSGDFVRVTFVPVGPAGQPVQDVYAAEVNQADGTFRVAGKDGTGMPPGKYRVAVELDHKRSDQLRGKFGLDKSPFTVDVDAGTAEVVVDLDNPPK